MGAIEVLGDIGNVLASRITPALMAGKKFSSKEYSIGLGALVPAMRMSCLCSAK